MTDEMPYSTIYADRRFSIINANRGIAMEDSVYVQEEAEDRKYFSASFMDYDWNLNFGNDRDCNSKIVENCD